MSRPTLFKIDDDGDWEYWVIKQDDSEFVLEHVHPEGSCGATICVIHNPTEHHMRDWFLVWRGDRRIFERICEHSVGHPDPDQYEYWKATKQEMMGVHGCDGCC